MLPCSNTQQRVLQPIHPSQFNPVPAASPPPSETADAARPAAETTPPHSVSPRRTPPIHPHPLCPPSPHQRRSAPCQRVCRPPRAPPHRSQRRRPQRTRARCGIPSRRRIGSRRAERCAAEGLRPPAVMRRGAGCQEVTALGGGRGVGPGRSGGCCCRVAASCARGEREGRGVSGGCQEGAANALREVLL
jgi:hypothetical protein